MTRRRGSIVPPDPAKGHTTFAIRFQAYGKRRFQTTTATNPQDAERELDRILAAVLLEQWEPPVKASEPEPVVEEHEPDDPSFERYAREWLTGKQVAVRERTLEKLRWSLGVHLVPWFGDLRVREISRRDVLAYVRAQQSRRALHDRTINQTLTVLATILDAAIELDEIHPGPNPATGKHVRIQNAGTPRRVWLELPQIRSLLDATTGEHRALLAVMVLGGLRVGEACALRWRDVDLANGRLDVAASKTDAGVRSFAMLPPLLDELKAHRARTPDAEPDGLLFISRRGRQRTRNNVRANVLAPAVERANVELEQAGELPIRGLTCHSLRRTACAFAFACGATVPQVMQMLGHTDPKMTLGVYAKVIGGNGEVGARAVELLAGDVRAVGSGSDPETVRDDELAELLGEA